jgi:hypothetical protein
MNINAQNARSGDIIMYYHNINFKFRLQHQGPIVLF